MMIEEKNPRKSVEKISKIPLTERKKAGIITMEKFLMEKLYMDIQNILSKCDHTLLLQTATWEQIKKICDEGMQYKTASVCIPPAYVEQAKAYVGDRLAVCTVIGFPNGYNTTETKVFETKDAIAKGADEIDMVINIGALKSGRGDQGRDEIKNVKEACGEKILKVIIEIVIIKINIDVLILEFFIKCSSARSCCSNNCREC